MADRTVIHIKGMHCASCVSRVERALEGVEGVQQAAVNLATEKAVITAAPGLRSEKLVAAVNGAGYEAEVVDPAYGLGRIFKSQTRDSWLHFVQFLVCLVLSVPVMVISMGGIYFPGVNWAMLGLSTGVLLIGGYGFIFRAVVGAFKFRADMDTLVALGTMTAYIFSAVGLVTGNLQGHNAGEAPGRHLYFETSVMILTFVLFGKWLESMAKGRATKSIKKLISLMPGTATLIKGESDPEEVPVEMLDAGDIILVRPGGRIPADGEVLSGTSNVDESAMTGENKPVVKGRGDMVLAGTINGNGAIKVMIKRTGEATALSGIIRLVEQAQSSKPPIQRVADRVASFFVPAVLVAALVTFAAWLIHQPGQGLAASLVPAVAVLLVSCPCALGLATPTAITVGAGLAAERGVLIRNAASLERLYLVDALVLDKTGTLTEGRHEVTDFLVLPGEDRLEVLSAAACLEQESEHSLSRAVVRFARMEGATLGGAEGFQAVAGMGISGVVQERNVVVGNTALLRHLGVDYEEVEDRASALRADGKTAVYVAVDGKVRGIIALADVVRPNAKSVVSSLRRMGLKVLMVTGDTRETALAMGKQVGIPPQEILSEVRPEDKAMVVRQLKKEGLQVGMVGDGINDAPALAEADVGVAMGTGTDIAIETADVTLGRDDIGVLLEAMRISHVTMKTIKQNLFWAFIYNITLIPVAAMGKLNPMYAAAAMSLSSVTVVVNSLLIRRSSMVKRRV